MLQGFIISASLATRLRTRGLARPARRRGADRLFRARLGLQIGLLLFCAVQKLVGVVALTGGELAAHLLVLRDLDDGLVGLALGVHARHVRSEEVEKAEVV